MKDIKFFFFALAYFILSNYEHVHKTFNFNNYVTTIL